MNTANMPIPETTGAALQQCVDWLEYHKAQVHHPVCTVHKPDARCSCGLHKVLTNLRCAVSDVETLTAERDEARRQAAAMRAALAMVQERWSFHDQTHTHTWHDWADCQPSIKKALALPAVVAARAAKEAK